MIIALDFFFKFEFQVYSLIQLSVLMSESDDQHGSVLQPPAITSTNIQVYTSLATITYSSILLTSLPAAVGLHKVSLHQVPFIVHQTSASVILNTYSVVQKFTTSPCGASVSSSAHAQTIRVF